MMVPPLESLNKTELLEMCRRQGYGFLRKSTPNERLIYLIENGGVPAQDDIALSTDSRNKLEEFIEQFWDRIHSQLPCDGPLKGKCTKYGCSEGRHADCLISARPSML